MTEHLYYADSYLTQFTAEPVEQLTVDGAPAVVLDRTAFYPTSGGQPHDTGSLGTARVIDVTERSDGAIVHVLNAPVAAGPLAGRVDWERRFDHMQQHTGQHILSQAFVRVARAATVSFHLGPETSTIDIDMVQADPEAIRKAEELAARTMMEDRAVAILTADRSELQALGVRKESRREGEIRVVDVDGFDRSPCGGTHVRRSGEIGILFISGYERYKGGTRIEFVCGLRALGCFRKGHDTLKQLGRLFSSHPDELPRLAERMLGENAALRRQNGELEEQLLELEAARLLESADKTEELFLVRRIYPARPLESIKRLAQKIAIRERAVAILATASEGKGQVVVAKGAGVSGSAGSWVREIALKLGGKGGGRPELAQAGGIEAQVLEEWTTAVADACKATRAPE